MALKVWLPLNGNLDNQGLSNYSFNNVDATVDTNGKIGKTYSFNGTSSRIYTNNVSLNSSVFTVSAWVKLASVPTSGTWYVVSLSQGTGGGADQQTCLYFNATGVGFGAGGVTTNFDYTFEANKWYHLAMTCDNVSKYLFINGTQVKTGTIGTVIGEYLTIGARNNSTSGAGAGASYFFNGTINDVRIYDECLSDKQIKEISKGLVAHYKLAMPSNENLATNTFTASPSGFYDYTGKATASRISDLDVFTSVYKIDFPADTAEYSNYNLYTTIPRDSSAVTQDGRTYTLSFKIKASKALSSYNLLYEFNGVSKDIDIGTTWQKVVMTGVANSQYSALYVCRNKTNRDKINGGSLYIAEMKLELNDHATPWLPNKADALYTQLGYDKILNQDSSGYGYDGVIGGTLVTSSNTARYINSTTFGNGWLHSIKTPLNTATEAFTYSIWYYPTATSNAALYNCRTEVGNGFSLFLLNNTDLRFDTNSSYQWTVANCITANQWNHIAITFNKNTGKKIYINGILKASTTTPGNLDTLNTIASIGISSNSSAVSGNIVYGNLSDARIYCTELSAGDILTLYKTSGIIDNNENMYSYEFIEED